MATALDPLRQTKTIRRTTYKRDGTPVATPVSIGPLGHRLMGARTLHYELDPVADGTPAVSAERESSPS